MSDQSMVVLDDAQAGHALVFRHPSSVITAHEADEVSGALRAMQQALDDGHHLAGYFSYELGYALEPRMRRCMPENRTAPLLWFGVFVDAPRSVDPADIAALWPPGRTYTTPLAVEWDRDEYRVRFASAIEAIAAGDIYQVNLSMRARFRLTGRPAVLYRDLRAQARAPHSAFVDDGERQILSFSPELFFEVDADGNVRTRPMKGTARRGGDAESDAMLRDTLSGNTKDRAENLMIVDLIRNDLGKLAIPGSVSVPDLFTVETYPTVHQMVSTVTATIPSPTRVDALLHALFPCGSITGAPKIRSMEIIRSLETSPRGVYCGAIGHFSPDGSARFNVAIRTLTIKDSQGELGIGGAIVSDSSADAEYDECLLKARYFDVARRPLGLIETLRHGHDGWRRSREHLDRMHASAIALGLHYDDDAAWSALRDAVAGAPSAPSRVRLHMDENGGFSATATVLDASAPAWRFKVSGTRIHSDDLLLRHKTDWRELYDSEYALAHGQGFDEVAFLNERGEICEGSRTNIFVVKDGRMLTPSRSSGILEGCLRNELIQSGACTEAVLTLNDLDTAETIYFGNSLRGLIRGISTSFAPGARGVADPVAKEDMT